jgi:hypothetical protein
MVGGKLHPNRGVGVGMYPMRRDGLLFSPERVGKSQNSKGSREEFPIRLGGKMIRGEGEYSSEKGNIQGVEGRKRGEKYPKLGKKIHFLCFLCNLLNTASSAAPQISLRQRMR